MKANELLLWLSARKEGTWDQFRGAVESLHLPDDAPTEEDESDDNGDEEHRAGIPLYQQLRLNLQRLAHAEFFAHGCDSGWRVAPPALAVRHDETLGWAGILCGARSRTLDGRLQQAIGSTTEYVEKLDGAPSLRCFSGSRDAIARLAAQAGLLLQFDAPLAILGSTRAVSHRTLPPHGELPVGRDWKVRRFSSRTLTWNDSSREEAAAGDGLFRFQFRHQWLHFFCVRGKAYEMRQGQIGKFHVLRHRRQRVLHYDSSTRQLSMRATCRPPLLVERALILCAGRLPSFNTQTSRLTYAGIPPLVARVAARLLGQEASL